VFDSFAGLGAVRAAESLPTIIAIACLPGSERLFCRNIK
jgi:hypothetical protein